MTRARNRTRNVWEGEKQRTASFPSDAIYDEIYIAREKLEEKPGSVYLDWSGVLLQLIDLWYGCLFFGGILTAVSSIFMRNFHISST